VWGNYEPIFSLMGLEVVKYPYFDPDSGTVNFDTLLDLVSQARPQNIFILQACCYSPLGIDLIQNQWQTLAVAMKKKKSQSAIYWATGIPGVHIWL
jgi:aspartate aminotransferase